MNTEIISAILNILNNKESVNFNQLAVTILSGLKTEQKTEESSFHYDELKNLTSIVKAAEKNSVIGQYITEDCKHKIGLIVSTVEYMIDSLTEPQIDNIIKDLKEIIDQIESVLTANLTEVLTKAGIRI